MPFILRPRGTCPASGHRITNSVKAIVCATANTPASVRERNYPSLITLLIALSHKLNRAISAPARQCIKTPTVSTKCSHFSVLSIILPSIIYRNTTALPSAVSPPLVARFREKGGYLSEPLRLFYKIASVKVAVSNATEISFCFQTGAVVGLAIRQQQKAPPFGRGAM